MSVNEKSQVSMPATRFVKGTLWDSISDMVLVVNRKSEIVEVNNACKHLFGYEPSELIGKHLNILLDEKFHVVHEQHMRDYSKHPSHIRMGRGRKLYGLHKDGRKINMDIALDPIQIDGKPFYSAIIRDIGEIREMEEKIEKQYSELVQLDETRKKFFSIISHDLKNPVISAHMFLSDLVEDLEKDKISGSELVKALKLVNTSTGVVHRLLNDLLEWSRVQTGALQIKKEELVLKSLVDDLTELHGLQAKSKEVQLEFNLQESSVITDRAVLYTILRNLISNAIKFTPEGGFVDVNIERDGGDLKIVIKDSGIGMDEEDLEKLFRIDVHPTEIGGHKEKGTGLGLIVCKEYVEKIGGNIDITSMKGEGTKVMIRIPAK